mmetsp:Transcript_12638/g.22660  ORF Transcript_12638/g.22660 Transcript_12638/m.22660 type:complete len:511 (+) Transcript_12638:86-1618(+)
MMHRHNRNHNHNHKMRGDNESLPSLIETMYDSIGSECSSMIDSIMDDDTLISMINADDSFMDIYGRNTSRHTETKRSPSSASGGPTVARRRLERPIVDQVVGKSDARSGESKVEQLERLANQARVSDASRDSILDMLVMARRLEENCTLQSDACYDDQDVGNTQRLRQYYAHDPSPRSDVSTSERYEKAGIDSDGTIGRDGVNRNKNCRSSNTTFRSNSDSGAVLHRKQKQPQQQYQQERLSQSEIGAALYYRINRPAEPTGIRSNSGRSSPTTSKFMTDVTQYWKPERGRPKSRSPMMQGNGQAAQSEGTSGDHIHQRRRNNSKHISGQCSSDGYKSQSHTQRGSNAEHSGPNFSGSTVGGQKMSVHSPVHSSQSHASSSRSIKSGRNGKSNRSSASEYSVPSKAANSTRSKRTSSSWNSTNSKQPHTKSRHNISTSSASFGDIPFCSSRSISQRSDEDDDCDYNSDASTSITGVPSVAEAVQYLNEHNMVERMAVAAMSLRGKIFSKF